jgi:hypothetical protein
LVLRRASGLLDGCTIACSALLCALLLYAVGQPIFTDDAWWHLALGSAYAAHGPWLDSDPLLFSAVAPPPPASWLADRLFYGVWSLFGFAGLRLLHTAIAAATLALAWVAVRRASGSASIASLGTAIFAALAAYRLVQLRPDLFTIAATVLIYLLVLEEDRPPSWQRIAAAAGAVCLWSNLHPAFPLGLVLIGAAFAASAVAAGLASATRRETARSRAKRLGAALILSTIASTLNPLGVSGHLLALQAGSSPESLAFVVDEWRPTDLFALPVENLPPSPLSWGLVWLLLLGSLAVVAFALRRATRTHSADGLALVPIALAATSLVAMVMASRFVWLGVFPILLIARAVREGNARQAPRLAQAGLAATATLLVTLSFLKVGAWPMVTRALPTSVQDYQVPYRAMKYNADITWLMADVGLRGNLIAPYATAGFHGFWISPGARAGVNGSLNVPAERMRAVLSAQAGMGTPEQPDLEALLDDLEVDLFLGAGLPTPGRTNRPPEYTTTRLERSPDWLLAFRTPTASLHLRRNARNEANLRALADHYASHGVPFDSAVGFEPARVIREAPSWATRHRIFPPELIALLSDGMRETTRWEDVAEATLLLLLLGEYEEASTLNDRLLERRPRNPAGHRRRLWLDLKSSRHDRETRIRHSAALLGASSSADPLSQGLLRAAKAALNGHHLPPSTTHRVPVATRGEAIRALRRLAPMAYAPESSLAANPGRPGR